MATKDNIEKAVNSGYISLETANDLMVYNERLSQYNVPVIYNLRHLRKILQIKKADQDKYFGRNRNEYHVFNIPKKSGGFRTIEAPSDKLKSYQLWIKENILDEIHISDCAKGFKRANSILDNAKEHIGKALVINLDIKNFFPSITYAQVMRIFLYIGYTVGVAHLLTQLCTNKDNVLPQGSPASPVISNIVSLKLDKRLNGIAKQYNCQYTRYADDITFSGEKNIKNMIPLVERIIEEEGFEINFNKRRLQYQNQRQEVTGLTVNKKINISPNLKREIDNAVYYCQKYSVESHMKEINCDKAYYKEHLYGIAYFIKMIDNTQGEFYIKRLDEIIWPY